MGIERLACLALVIGGVGAAACSVNEVPPATTTDSGTPDTSVAADAGQDQSSPANEAGTDSACPPCVVGGSGLGGQIGCCVQ